MTPRVPCPAELVLSRNEFPPANGALGPRGTTVAQDRTRTTRSKNWTNGDPLTTRSQRAARVNPRGFRWSSSLKKDTQSCE
jgi:hypothetical protein